MDFFSEIDGWSRFEDLVQAIFTRHGWIFDYKPAVGPDGGRDLICEKRVDQELSSYSIKMLIQCKFYSEAVGLSHAGEIYTTAKSFGVNVYLIATSSRLTTGLQNRLEQLERESSIEFRSLNGTELETAITRDEDLFRQFLPVAYGRHLELQKDVNEYNLSRAFEQHFGHLPTESELTDLLRLRLKYPTSKIADYRQVWDDQGIKRTLDRLYRKTLKRSVDAVGLVAFGLALKHNLADEEQVLKGIKQSREYLQLQPKIDLSFEFMPEMNVLFDRRGFELLGWWTYHGRDYRGFMEVLVSSSGKKYVCLRPSPDQKAFRLAFPVPGLDILKKKVRIEYRTADEFEFFALVEGNDHKPYYLGFRSKKSGPITHTSGGVDYALGYIGTTTLDGNWHVLDRSLARLLSTRFGVKLKTIKYFCFVVHGEFHIRSLQMS